MTGVLFIAALATEDPSPDLLLETPHGRTEPLINKAMWLHIFVQGFYQIFWLMLIFYGAPAQLKVSQSSNIQPVLDGKCNICNLLSLHELNAMQNKLILSLSASHQGRHCLMQLHSSVSTLSRHANRGQQFASKGSLCGCSSVSAFVLQSALLPSQYMHTSNAGKS